jgi:hypothetical protein
LVEGLFRAYFLDGRFIGDRTVLAGHRERSGSSARRSPRLSRVGRRRGTIDAMDQRVRELGVSGVPFFIFDSRVAVSARRRRPRWSPRSRRRAPQTLADSRAASGPAQLPLGRPPSTLSGRYPSGPTNGSRS